MRKTTFLIFLIFFLVFSGCSLYLYSQEARDLIARADELFSEMADMAMAEQARSKYQEAMLKAGDKYDAFWKMARILYYIGAHTDSNKEKKAIFGQGIYYAKRAVELQPQKPDGYFWLGVNYGVYGEARGVLNSLFLVDDIKEAMNKVIELDRSYEDGGPDRVLGRVYFKLPGFVGGSNEKSLEHLLKSKEFGPNDPVTHIYMADTHLALKEIDKAREELEFILNMEPDSRWASGVDEAKKVAGEMLQRKPFRTK